ncbi:MAG: hypothetical protein HXY34_00480 [Candidatus Thorarchaeota archaeon]|nr:hypothetical protein [Candidatus Thorarchaeota archaeon]
MISQPFRRSIYRESTVTLENEMIARIEEVLRTAASDESRRVQAKLLTHLSQIVDLRHWEIYEATVNDAKPPELTVTLRRAQGNEMCESACGIPPMVGDIPALVPLVGAIAGSSTMLVDATVDGDTAVLGFSGNGLLGLATSFWRFFLRLSRLSSVLMGILQNQRSSCWHDVQSWRSFFERNSGVTDGPVDDMPEAVRERATRQVVDAAQALLYSTLGKDATDTPLVRGVLDWLEQVRMTLVEVGSEPASMEVV